MLIFVVCHPERSSCFARRSSYAVEGSLAAQRQQPPYEEFPPHTFRAHCGDSPLSSARILACPKVHTRVSTVSKPSSAYTSIPSWMSPRAPRKTASRSSSNSKTNPSPCTPTISISIPATSTTPNSNGASSANSSTPCTTTSWKCSSVPRKTAPTAANGVCSEASHALPSRSLATASDCDNSFSSGLYSWRHLERAVDTLGPQVEIGGSHVAEKSSR